MRERTEEEGQEEEEEERGRERRPARGLSGAVRAKRGDHQPIRRMAVQRPITPSLPRYHYAITQGLTVTYCTGTVHCGGLIQLVRCCTVWRRSRGVAVSRSQPLTTVSTGTTARH